VLAAGGWWLVAGGWVLVVVGCWLLVVGCWLLLVVVVVVGVVVVVVVVVAAPSSSCSPGTPLHWLIDRQTPLKQTQRHCKSSLPASLQVPQTREGKK
jgi:hypothetical protein